MPATILLVEDEPAIIALLQLSLQQAGYDTLSAPDATTARDLIRDRLPDLILLDWMLPDQPGIALARQLRRETRTRDVPLIMLTARASEQDTVEGLEAGADDYVTKPFSPRELVARIRSLLRRRTPQGLATPVQIGPLRLDPSTGEARSGQRALPMTPTEFRLLHFLVTHAGRAYNRRQLLDQVWGDHVFIEERTVDVHIRRLRRALRPANLADHIETLRSIGYRFRTPPDP